MAKFYVGQRVRIVWAGSDVSAHLVGKEATVTSPLCKRHHFAHGEWEGHYVLVDGEPANSTGSATLLAGHLEYCPRPSSLEPIVPEGSQSVVSWKECPWMPEHMRETA